MKTVSIGKLGAEVESILSKYQDDVADGVDDAALESANQCLKDIKSNASSMFNSHNAKKPYAKQWTKKQTEKARGKSSYTVYCKTPGLPHLLENGHALASGGRVAGRPHIAPAEEKAVDAFQRKVEEVIQNASN